MSQPAPKRGKPCPFAFDDFEEGKHPRAENGEFGSGGGSSSGGSKHTTYTSGGASTKEPAGEHVDTDTDIDATSHDGKAVTYDLAYHHDGDTVRGHVHNVRNEEGTDAFEGLDRVQAYKLGKALSAHAEAHVAAYAAGATEESRQEHMTPEEHEAEVAAHKAATAKAEAAKATTIGGAVETLLARGWTPAQGKYHQQPELKGFASPSSVKRIKELLRAKGHAVDEALGIAADWATVLRSSEPRIAVDRSPSVRRFDPDSGHLHVTRTPLSKANVCGYLGSEIPGWQALGLTGDRIYKLYRHPEELKKAVETVNGKPLLVVHKASSADDHPHRDTAGAVNGGEWDAPYLMGGLDIWTKDAIDGIESGERQELSPGYAYDPDMTPGTTPSGERYDGVMRNIRFNHVALVPEGRTGRDVYVHDAAPTHRPRMKDMLMAGKAVPTRSAAAASSALSGALHGALLTYARPMLAADQKLDVKALLKGVTVKNVKAKAPTIARAFDAAVKKLAKDAEVEQSDVEDIIEQVGELIAEKAPDIAAAVEPDPDVASDDDDTDLRALLKAKGYSDEEIDAICAKKAMPVEQAATDAEKAAAEAVKGMDAKIAAAKRDATAEARRGMVEQSAMDAAIEGAVTAERQRNKDIREAEAHVANSPVGKLAGAFDSAPDVYRAGLAAMGVKDVDASWSTSALKAVFDANAGVRVAQTPTMPHLASDSAQGARKGLHERFPNLQRLRG